MSIQETLKGLVFKKPDADPRRSNEHIAGGRRAGETENPYLASRRTWNHLMGSMMTQRMVGILVGILGMLIGLAGVGGMIHIGSQSKFIPYIVEVDKLGNTQSYGQVEPGMEDAKKKQRVIASRIASFINDARLVTPDVKLQRDAVFRTYAVLSPSDPATQKMNEWLNGTNESSPFARAAKVTVSVEIKSVMRQSPETWQVDWIETTRDRQGVRVGDPKNMRALVTVYESQPSTEVTEEEMWMNPLRLFVRDFTWAEQL